ncbi:MAG: hypothetical protein IJV15_14300 [Lachnospiraceae bacterium]|nr:hypothetical protein [Lachnospiraceae bacterium]
MWYVIQTISGKEHEVCLWINTYVDKDSYTRCFVPLYEDVWRKEGIGHISIKRLFAGYIFIETDTPDKVYEELKGLSKMSVLLSIEKKTGREFLCLHKEEEVFFDTILSDGLMKVSYIHMNKQGKPDIVIGPLQSYKDNIVRLDIPHRRAIVNIPMLGEEKRLKFGLWLDIDPKISWIEEEKNNRRNDSTAIGNRPDNPWDWKAWKQHNKDKKKLYIDKDVFGYRVGDYIINTTGIYGDTPMEITKLHPEKNSVTVNALLFGSMTEIMMGINEIEVVNDSSASENCGRFYVSKD